MKTHSFKDEDGDESNEESLFLAIKEKNKGMSERLEFTKS